VIMCRAKCHTIRMDHTMCFTHFVSWWQRHSQPGYTGSKLTRCITLYDCTGISGKGKSISSPPHVLTLSGTEGMEA
jgi:hypothetical protein